MPRIFFAQSYSPKLRRAGQRSALLASMNNSGTAISRTPKPGGMRHVLISREASWSAAALCRFRNEDFVAARPPPTSIGTLHGMKSTAHPSPLPIVVIHRLGPDQSSFRRADQPLPGVWIITRLSDGVIRDDIQD